MHLLLIETTQGSIKATPIEHGRKKKQFTCEFWDERDLNEFINEYQISPICALFSYECIKQKRILKEAGQ